MVDIRIKPVTLKKAAEHFDVTVKTVRCWARGVGGHRLETVKVGGKVYTNWEAINRFAVQQTGELSFTPESDSLALQREEARRILREEHGIEMK